MTSEGKHVFATLLKKRAVTAFIIALLSLSFFVTCFTPKVKASPTTIVSISPSSGYVGDLVRLNGNIDTANGTYRIFFDDELVSNGTASSNKAVDTTFLVPHRYKGNYTVKLYDVKANATSAPKNFIINTKYYINAIIPPQQTQLMESQSTTIRVNVTGGELNTPYWANATVRIPSPVNTVYYNSSLQLTNTARIGEYLVESIYPRDFGPSAHTNYTGTYTLAFNNTIATGSFKVGLTNATDYHRFGAVAIQGANYTQLNERVWINITSSGKTVFSTNVQAIGGVINTNWNIPWNATYGTYNITTTSSTAPGTTKPIRDTQIFTISKATFQCLIQVKNLDNETVSGVNIAAYNGTSFVSSAFSNNSGIAKLSLETYTYSLKAYLKSVQVGNISALSIKGNTTQTLVCQLVNINLFIKDANENPLPFITIDLKYNYTRTDGIKVPDTITLETDNTGIAKLQNTFINISYIIEAKRYGYIFNRTSIANLKTSQWINITCPTYTLFVHVVDSKELPMTHVSVNVTEWSSELLAGDRTWTTDNFGSLSLNLTFGRYKIKAYNYSAEIDRLVIINETIIDLTENKPFEKIICNIVNLSPSVLVVDYFGQPIANAEVEVERFSEIDQEWIQVTPFRRTDSSGIASLPSIGGDYSISVYVLGQLSGIKSLRIDETSTLVFKIDKYTLVGGLFMLETSQLLVSIVIVLLIISMSLILTYKKIWHKTTKK